MVIAIGTFAMFQSCSVTAIRGNGNLVTSEKSVSTFEKISNAGTAEVRYHASEGYRIVVTVDENLEEYVEISTNNNVLYIGTKKNTNCSFTKFLVDVYCPVLTGISIAGSGDFEGVDKIVTSTFTLSIAGSGNIEGTIECDNFSAKIAGSGSVTIAGTSKDADMSISGHGNFNCIDFYIKNASVNIAGSGNVNISVDDNLKVNIAGSGDINYRGEPNIEKKIAGSGSVNKR